MKKMKKNLSSAFSLMEMMVVLLIISIIAAASAPMVSRKLSRDAGTAENPWVYTDLNGNIAYNISGNTALSALIGAARVPNEQITFGDHTKNVIPRLFIGRADDDDNNYRPAISIDNAKIIDIDKSGSILIGNSVHVGVNGAPQIAIGDEAMTDSDNAIAIGSANAAGSSAIAIGGGAAARGDNSIAIGNAANTNSNGAEGNGNSIAIGNGAHTEEANSIAIGNGAETTGANSVAIGNGVNAEANQTKISNNNVTIEANTISIYRPNEDTDHTVIEGDIDIATVNFTDTATFNGTVNFNCGNSDGIYVNNWDKIHLINAQGQTLREFIAQVASAEFSSDRRLKNVGDKFTDGLDALKKLDFFHYTFKEDKDKIQHVGVMAQDLQKVFPNAVITGDDGYLRIRLEDMFYAVINAVKELDTRISEVVNQVKANLDEITKLKATVEAQQKTIDELKAQNAEFEKRLERLEKKAPKAEKAQKEPKAPKEKKSK